MAADLNGYVVTHTERHLHVAFAGERKVLSSAVLSGGLARARHVVNLRVAKNTAGTAGRLAPPGETLAAYCRRQGWRGPVVGMMTAATMASFRHAEREEQGVSVSTLVTAGVSNAGRAGEPAAHRRFEETVADIGTVNIVVVTNAVLTEAALVEAVMTVTEAKAAAFQDLGIRSAATGSCATGTGTDAVAVAAGFGPRAVHFCGKHVLFGEMLAETTIRAISESLGS